MPEYFYSAVDASGHKFTDSVEAESALDAKRHLEEDGCCDIVLHSDDVMASVTRFDEKTRKVFSPKELVRFGRMRPHEYFIFLLGRSFRSSWLLCLFTIGLLVWRRYDGSPWDGLDYFLLTVPFLPFAIVPLGIWFGPARAYQRLLEAVVDADWDGVLDRVEGLKKTLPANEYAYRKAQAFICLGDVEDGLLLFQKLEFTADIPEWLFCSLMAELYFLAKQKEQGLAISARAVEAVPDNLTVLLSHADHLLVHESDAAAAAEILQRARVLPCSDLLRYAWPQVEGILALETGNALAARAHLEKALEFAEVMRPNGLYPLVRARIETYLCLACAAVGDLQTGRSLFDRVERLLLAHRKEELLERCRRALQLPNPGLASSQ